MNGRGILGLVLAGAAAVTLVAALAAKKRNPDLDQATYDYLMKQEIARKTPGSFSRDEMTGLIKDRQKRAIAVLAAHGLSFDGSIDSIKGLDRLVDKDPDAARAGAEALGVYLGEAIRAITPGTWTGQMSNGRLDLDLELKGGEHIWPLERVRKRIDLGPSEGLFGYAASIVGRGEVIDLSDVKVPADKPARKK